MQKWKLRQGKLREHDDGEWYRADEVDALLDRLMLITKPDQFGRVSSEGRSVREEIREQRRSYPVSATCKES